MEIIALEAALNRIDDDYEIYCELIAAFLEDSLKDIQELTQAIEEEDTKKAIYHTHKLKGAALTLGADFLSSFAESLERTLPQNNSSECRTIFEKTKKAYFEAITRLKEIQQELQTHF